MACAHVVISGRVQGVGFRYWVAREAESRRVSGWVRNLTDGRVEAVFCGEDDNVRDMLERAGKGPQFASVSSVDLLETVDEEYSGFEIRP